MSFPISRQLADHLGALLAAVTEVAENSLFTFADASDEATFDVAAAAAGIDDTDGDWLRASIRFTGPVAGQFALTVPVGLARRLGAAFAGADTANDMGEDDLIDFTGELVNMMCGTWLTRACQHEAFTLTPPRVLRGGPDRAMGGEPDDAESTSFYLAIDDTPIRLEIGWSTAAPTAPCSVPERADAP